MEGNSGSHVLKLSLDFLTIRGLPLGCAIDPRVLSSDVHAFSRKLTTPT